MRVMKKRRVFALLATVIMAVSMLASASAVTVHAAASRSELEAQLKALKDKEKQIKGEN